MAQRLVGSGMHCLMEFGVMPHPCELSRLLHPPVRKGITQGALQKAGEELTKVCKAVTVICIVFLGKC